MKKLLALFLSIVMVLSLFSFAACSKKKDTDKDEETTPEETTAVPDDNPDTVNPSEGKTNKTFLNYIGDYVDLLKNSYNTGTSASGDIAIEVSPEFINMLFDTSEVDITWLKEINADCSAKTKKGVQEIALTLGINGVDMITVEYIMDLINTEAMYIRFPDLSKAYQRIEADGTDIASSLYAALPEGDVVEKLIEKYFDIIAAQIKDTEKENATVTVEGVSQDCVKHSFVLDNEVLGRIFEAVLTELKDDQDVKDIIKRYAEDVGNDGDEAVSEFEEFISDSLEDNKDREGDEDDEEENIPVNVALYLTEDDSFVGMEMSFEDDSFSILFPSNEGKTAFKYQMFEEDYLDFNIVGHLKTTDGKLNGELKANLDGKHIVTVKLTDYGADYSDPDNLTASGSVELLFTKDFLDVAIDPWEKENLPEAILELLEKPLTVKVDMDMKNQESKTVASIISDGKELIKTTANMTTEAPKDITIPTEYYDTDNEKDMEEYAESMNTVKFALSLISKLSKAGVPDEFLADLIA